MVLLAVLHLHENWHGKEVVPTALAWQTSVFKLSMQHLLSIYNKELQARVCAKVTYASLAGPS